MTIGPRSTIADVAAAVTAALESAGFRAVLTGGACATIYSAGPCQSHDLDFILEAGGGQRALDRACRDRLAAFYDWSDRQSLEAAVAIARRHRVNMRFIAAWSARKGAADQFGEFRRAVRARR